MNNEPQTQTIGEHIQGKDIELNTFDEIEKGKHQLLINFSSFEITDIKAQMKDLFALMESVLMGGYFSDQEVTNYRYPEDAKVFGYSYNFLEYNEMIELAEDKDSLRTILKNSYIIYNRFKKRLKISVSTEQKNPIERSPEPILLHNRKSSNKRNDALKIQREMQESEDGSLVD